MKFINLNMRYILFLVFFIGHLVNAQNLYYPDKVWEEKSPKLFDYDDKKILAAIDFAINNENKVDRNLNNAIIKAFGHEPGFEIKGANQIKKRS